MSAARAPLTNIASPDLSATEGAATRADQNSEPASQTERTQEAMRAQTPVGMQGGTPEGGSLVRA